MKIYQWPHEQEILRVPAEKVQVPQLVKDLADEMVKTMTSNGGYGLAAPQIGKSLQVIVVTVDGEPVVMVNPEIINFTDSVVRVQEGCLSIPGFFDSVLRFEHVTVKYFDLDGNERVLDTSTLDPAKNGLTSRCIQHEVEHLEGILFIDHMTELKRNRARSVVEKTNRLRKKKRIVS